MTPRTPARNENVHKMATWAVTTKHAVAKAATSTERLMRNRIHDPVLGSSAPGAAPAPETLRGPSLVVVETVAKLPGNQNIRPVRRHP